jgi:hypothetical protein
MIDSAVLGPSGSGAVSKTVIKAGSNPVHRTKLLTLRQRSSLLTLTILSGTQKNLLSVPSDRQKK